MRSRMRAIQPPSRPPPKIAVRSSTSFTSHNDPWACITSLMPPCSMITDNAISAPTANHQKKMRMEDILREVVAPIQAAVLDGLGEMGRQNRFRAGKVGDRARHAKDPAIGARGEAELRHGLLDQLLAVLVQRAVLFELSRFELRIAEDAVGAVSTGLPQTCR